MKQYVIQNGLYQKAFKEMPKACLLPLTTNLNKHETNNKTRTNRSLKNGRKAKYSCSCGINIWGKPSLHIICGKCNQRFQFVSLV